MNKYIPKRDRDVFVADMGYGPYLLLDHQETPTIPLHATIWFQTTSISIVPRTTRLEREGDNDSNKLKSGAQ